MHSRNGKIARLPKTIRDEINQRLDDGHSARSLVTWLNALPKVKALVKRQFGGHPIREQNVSQWKQGGYQEWLRHRDAMELAERLYERAAEMKEKEEEQMPMTEVLSLWIAARYAAMTEELAMTSAEEGRKQLHQMCGDVAKLRRLSQQAQRLELEKERVLFERAKTEIIAFRWKEEERELKAEAESAQRRREKEEKEHCLSPAERRRRIREIYGLPPEPEEEEEEEEEMTNGE